MVDVPFLDVGASYHELKSDIDAAVERVLNAGWYIGGQELSEFEAAFATFVEAKYCVGTGNGLDAINLSLRALGVGPGDEVIVPSNTFIATWLAVSHAGAVPVPVEPLEETFNLDPDLVRAAITSRTRAIIPVHLYGQPADLDPLLMVAREHGLLVVEDAAQAHGARYRGRRVGAHSDAVAWSFYPGKNLGAFGDGGAVTTDNQALAEAVRMLGNYGSRSKYVNDYPGLNSRLDPIQAAILRVKLAHLDEWNARRRSVAEAYLGGLAGLPLALPNVPDWAEPVWHLFVVRASPRDEILEALRSMGVQAAVHYPVAPHMQRAYAGLEMPPGSFPISERIHREVLSLPMGPHLSSSDVHRVIDALHQLSS